MEENNQNSNPSQPVSPVEQTPTPSVIPVNSPSVIPSSTGNPSPIDSKPAKKFSIKLIIGIILFLLIVGSAAGFYAFKPQIMKLVSNPDITPTVIQTSPTPTPPPAGGPTANWETYQGDDFSFKYPSDAEVTVNETENSVLLIPIKIDEYRSSNDPEKYRQIYRFSVRTIDNPTNQTITQYIESTFLTRLEAQTEPGPSEAKAARDSIKEKEYPNFTATSITMGHTELIESLYIAHGDKIYYIGMISDESAPFPETQPIINQILSTFKFTE